MQAWEYALELKTETFDWWLSEKGQWFGMGWSEHRNTASPVARELVNRVEAKKLAIASPFYVTGEMCDLLTHASATFPVTKLRPDDLPVTLERQVDQRRRGVEPFVPPGEWIANRALHHGRPHHGRDHRRIGED